eukprot:GEMP01000011.1.p1 GENE.GEMP01000011.1~~GEMP01000011.1.p1  ORF type:complete len:5020 (+),score=1237.73 GEMP01000011.1:156-15215(+)
MDDDSDTEDLFQDVDAPMLVDDNTSQYGPIPVTFVVSVDSLVDEIAEVIMHGTSPDMGLGDVPYNMRRIHGQKFLWSCTVTLPRYNALNGREGHRVDVSEGLGESRVLFYVSYVCFARGSKVAVIREERGAHDIPSPLRQQYFHVIRHPEQARLAPQEDAQKWRRHTSEIFFDYLLWDFERGTVREGGDIAPVMSPKAFVENVRSLQNDFKGRSLLVHFVSRLINCNLVQFEIGRAISSTLDYAHVPPNEQIFALNAVFGSLLASSQRHNRNHMTHGMLLGPQGRSPLDKFGTVFSSKSESGVKSEDLLIVCNWIVNVSQRISINEIKDILGPYFRLGLEGIRFAAVYLYRDHGSYSWFDLLPMLQEGEKAFASQGIGTFDQHAADALLRNYAVLVERVLSSPEAHEGWKLAIESLAFRMHGDPYAGPSIPVGTEDDERRIATIARHKLLDALVEFCPTVEALNMTFLARLRKYEFDLTHSHYALTRVRYFFLLNHDFHLGKECTDFIQLLNDNGDLLYGPDDEDTASEHANTMAECILKNDTVGKRHASMIQLLERVLGNYAPQARTLTAMRKWIRSKYAREPKEMEELRIVEFTFVAHHLLPALEAWEDMVNLSCFNKVVVDHPLLAELQSRWFFRATQSLVALRAVLYIESEPSFPKSRRVVDRVMQTIARSILQELNEGKLLRTFIDNIMEPGKPISAEGTALRCDLVFAILEHIGVTAASAARADNIPLKEVLTHAPTIADIYRWTKKGKNVPRTTMLHKFLDALVTRLTDLGTQCATKAITLSDLNTIVSSTSCTVGIRDYLWPAMTSNGVSAQKLANIKRELDQFDKELKEFGTYTKMYCLGSKIEAKTVDATVEALRKNYGQLHLKDVIGSFMNEPALHHVAWLFSVHESSLFLGVWQIAAAEIERKSAMQTGGIDQATCVSKVIPLARNMWVHLEASLRTGECSYPDANRMFGHLDRKSFLHQTQINREVELLNETTPHQFQRVWCDTFLERVAELRKVERLTLFVPSILRLHEYLTGFVFSSTSRDATLDVFRKADTVLQTVPTWNLATLIPKSRDIIQLLDTTPSHSQDFLIAFTRRRDLVDFLIRPDHRMIMAFKTRIRLVLQCTDDERLLNGLLQFSVLRASVDDLLFSGPFDNLKAFLTKLNTCLLGGEQLKSLEIVVASFDGLLDLLERNTENVGAKAWKEVMRICARGTFIAQGTNEENQQLICVLREDDSNGATATVLRKEVYNFEQLVEMRKLLLITDVADDQELNEKPIKRTLEEFIQKIRVLEDIRQAVALLHASGHFRYANMVAFEISPAEDVDAFRRELEDLKTAYGNWQEVVSSLRSEYYFFNYFFVSQLRIVRDDLLDFASGKSAPWARRWEGLTSHILGPQVDMTCLNKVRTVLMNAGQELHKGQAHELQLRAIARILENAYSNSVPLERKCKLTLDPAKKIHQGDLIISAIQETVDRSGGSCVAAPVFICVSTEGDAKVLDTVMSIYLRRDRLPQPDELLICDDTTSLEEIELMFRRFMRASEFHRKHHIFCIANVQQLPYTTQCAAAELLRAMLSKCHLFERCAALVFVSGDSNHVLLTSAITTCHAQQISMPVLPKKYLRKAMTDFCPNASAIISEINGAGKTTQILLAAYEMQEDLQKRTNASSPPVVYHRVSMRENSSSEDFLTQLYQAPTPAVVHIDIGHIVPRQVNSLLFHLLCVGTVMDPKTLTVFRRTEKSQFMVEVPYTPGNIMLESLSLISFIPTTVLQMQHERLQFELPRLNDQCIVEMYDNVAMQDTVRWVRAIQCGRFLPGERRQPLKSSDNWDRDVLLKETVTQREVWDVLVDRCCNDSGTQPPSFLIFHNFCRFMSEQFKRVLDFPILSLELSVVIGMPTLRHYFCRLLVETSQGFSLRQVPKMEISIERIGEDAARELRSSPSHLSREQSSGQFALGATPSRTLSRENSFLTNSPKMSSSTLLRSATTEAAQEAGGAGRVDAENYIHRFNQMASWESTDHPVTLFKYNGVGPSAPVVGIDLIALNKDLIIQRYLNDQLVKCLLDNQIQVTRDWANVTSPEAINLIRFCKGLGELPRDHSLMHQITMGHTKYVVTIDNLLKILSILLRLEYGLPVILMGETGCGKTALVQFIVETLEFPMHVIDVHGGITDAQVIDFIRNCIKVAAHLSDGQYLVAFLDEINAGNVLGVCKMIIVDRMLDGKPIPKNVRIVACCNPYRSRMNVEDEQMALVYQHHYTLDGGVSGAANANANAMKKLVYRVHPLPESLIDLVSDFGAISAKTEGLYIRAILFRELTNDKNLPWFTEFIEVFTLLIAHSHEYTRQSNSNERSVVSLRDVARSTRVFHWFLEKYPNMQNVGPVEAYCVATILTLGYCYYSRLNRVKRKEYLLEMCTTWKAHGPQSLSNNVWTATFSDAVSCEKELKRYQLRLVRPMVLGEGIALNEALRENLFMLLVSVMNQIPIFVIGKPGCSKSLAVEILQRNLNGTASENPFFKQMPAVHIMPYQCSPFSTASGIQNQFDNARKYAGGDASHTIVCVLLDEVGLAEESPHLPLKVLHKELEQKCEGIVCIGISNWSLDAAKMSRAVTLFRPPPDVDDLCQTAEGMVSSHIVRGYLRALSESFFHVYQVQRRPDFWGLREFYSIVRVINSELHRQQEHVDKSTQFSPTLDPSTLMNTVLRNFGGRTSAELEEIIAVFFEKCCMRQEVAVRQCVRDLIRQNLAEPDARHLMLLTQNNSALRLLFDLNIATWEHSEVLFGSSFEDDQNDMMVATNLNRIKSMMNRPMCLILVQCDSLYESLYDLLNQHYIEFAGQRFVRIAHGSSSKECPVHYLFRVIVITEKWEAWTTLAPPLLNRFEKQIFVRGVILDTPLQKEILETVKQYFAALVEDFSENARTTMANTANARADDATGPAGDDASFLEKAQRVIVGYHGDLLPSLVLSLHTEDITNRDELVGMALRKLIWVMTPECVTAVEAKSGAVRSKKYSSAINPLWPDLGVEYFKHQAHEDLREFVQHTQADKNLWTDGHGGQFLIMTHTPIGVHVVDTLTDIACSSNVRHAVLHDHKSGVALENEINQFYASETQNLFIIQANVWASPIRQMEFCRYTCERKRYEWLKDLRDESKVKMLMIVIHLVRGVQRFNFEFDRRWCTVFIDAVSGASISGLPSLDDMLHKPLGEVMKKVVLRQVLPAHVLRPALAHLVYPTKRTSADLSNQIKMLLKFLADDTFLDLINGILSNIFSNFDMELEKEIEKAKKEALKADETFSGSQFEWHVIAQTPERMQRAGTFRAALHSRLLEIMQALMSRLLAWFDRNNQLYLFGVGGKTQALWLDMAHYSVLSSTIKESMIGCLSAENPHSMQDVENNSLSEPFTAQFPFSFTIASRVADLRAEFAGKVDDDTDCKIVFEALERVTKQWLLAKVPVDPLFQNNGIDYKVYLADFVAMHLEKSSISPAQQAELVAVLCRKSLRLANSAPLRSIFDIHIGFWLNERRIFNLNHLLAAVPETIDEVLATIDAHKAESNLCLDVMLVNKILSRLLDRLRNMTNEKGVKNLTDKYEAWCVDVTAVVPSCAVLLSAQVSDSDKELSRKHFDELRDTGYPRVMLVAQFIRDVAYPLGLPVKTINALLGRLPNNVRSLETCAVLMETFTSIIDAETDKSRLSPPVLGHFLEWFLLHLCVTDCETLNRQNDDFVSLLVRTCGGCAWSKHGDTVIPRQAPAQREYIMSFCQLGRNSVVVPKTESFMLALLRKLLDPLNVKPNVDVELRKLLAQQDRDYKHRDVPLMQLLILSHEEFMKRGHLRGTTSTAPTGCHEWTQVASSVDLREVYQYEMDEKAYFLAIIRRVLGQYAAYLRAQFFSARQGADHNEQARTNVQRRASAVVDETAMVPLVHKWLERNNNVPYRSMRLFVLKHLNHMGGHTELQNALTRVPLSEAPWVRQWLEEHDTSFERFVGASVLPKWDPFGDIESYNVACKDALHKFVLSNGSDVESLDLFATRMEKDSKTGKRKLLAGFALALATEAGIQYAQPVARRPECLLTLHAWIEKSAALKVSREIKNLLLIFSGSTEKIANNPHMSNFVLNANGATGEIIFQYRFLAHVFAACLDAGENSPMRFFANMLFCPEKLTGTYLVCMDQDLRDMLQKVMQGEEGYTVDMSRFYQCRNGHQYYIGNCGKAYTQGKCPECGEVIGGGGHVLAEGNVQMSKEDKSPTGYTFPSVKEQTDQEMYDQRRDLPPASYRCLRTILHAVMLLGVAARSDKGSSKVCLYEPMFTKTHAKLRGSEEEWFAQQFHRDWVFLKKLLVHNVEEVSKVLHELLSKLMVAEAPKCRKFITVEERNRYEIFLEDQFFQSRFTKDGIVAKLEELNARWRSVEGPFMQELAQTAELDRFPPELRHKNEPLSWCFYRHFDFSVLSQSLYSTPGAAKLYPILTAFVRDYQKFESLKCLSGIVTFQQLLSQRFSRSLTQSEARTWTFSKVYDGLPHHERNRWCTAFEAWTRAWNSGFSTWIKNWECLELPQQYRNIRMGKNMTLAFLLPAQEDEGICPLVLMQTIVEGHNAFMGVVAAARNVPCVKKSSRVVDEKDVLDYTIERLLDFCNESAVNPLPGGGIDCDLNKVEHHLRQYFATKPVINLELKLQQFAFQDSNVYGVSSIGSKLSQLPLGPEVAFALQRDIRDKRVLGELQQCIKTTTSFLSRTLARSLQADHHMLLSEYWNDVLGVQTPLPSHVVQTEIQLCHIDAMWDLMESAARDDFEAVLDKYKQGLSQEHEAGVIRFAQSLVRDNLKEFLPILKEYILQWLTTDDRQDSDPLKVWLSALEGAGGETFDEVDWFVSKFPKKLEHRNAVHTYLCLKTVLTGEKQELTRSRSKLSSVLDAMGDADDVARGSADPPTSSGTARPMRPLPRPGSNRDIIGIDSEPEDDDDARGTVTEAGQKSKNKRRREDGQHAPTRPQDDIDVPMGSASDSDVQGRSICCSPAMKNPKGKNEDMVSLDSADKKKKRTSFLKVISKKAKKLIGIREKPIHD